MSNHDDDDKEWDDKDDLTGIEDLGEFHHEDDPDLDAKLSNFSDDDPPPFFENDEQNDNESYDFDNFSDEEELMVSASETEIETDPESEWDKNQFFDSENEITQDFEIPPEFHHPETETESHDDDNDDFEQETRYPNASDLDLPAPPSITPQLESRETFQDIQKFDQAITYGTIAHGGNPPFSVMARKITFKEDGEDIISLLREHGILTEDNEKDYRLSLERGSLLLSQLSEYSALYLAHKLRRFCVDLKIGLSDQLHPSPSYPQEGRGLISKYNLYQNHREQLVVKDKGRSIDSVIMTTTPQVEGHQIYEYIKVLTTHKLLNKTDLEDLMTEDFLKEVKKEEYDHDENSFFTPLNSVYENLTQELKSLAFKADANAVVGINYSLTPISLGKDNQSDIFYKIVCSGNAVWVVDFEP